MRYGYQTDAEAIRDKYDGLRQRSLETESLKRRLLLEQIIALRIARGACVKAFLKK